MNLLIVNHLFTYDINITNRINFYRSMSIHSTFPPGKDRISTYLQRLNIHVWQSRVEIEHYSVAYFARIAAFEAL